MTDTAIKPSKPVVRPVHRPSLINRLGLEKYSALYLWGAFMVFFGITASHFLEWTSIKLVLTEKVIVGVLALAFLVPLTADTFDLSIGAMMGLSLVIVNTIAKQHHIPQGFGIPIALGACALAGFISGFIVVRLKVNSFIATLGMSQLINATMLRISNNRQINSAFSNTYRDVGRKEVFGLPLYLYYFIILAVAMWFVLEHTPLGRRLFATGGNREAARLSGVPTDRLIWGTLVVSAVIGGFAGVVQSWKVGTFGNDVGPGFLFPAIAAVFFGASQLRGRPNVWGTIIAVCALAFGVKGLQLTLKTGTFWLEPAFNGLSLLIAVAFASRQAIVKIRKRKPASSEASTASTA